MIRSLRSLAVGLGMARPSGSRSGTLDWCSVCGGDRFEHTPVLWDDLVAEWGLSSEEAAYTDRQQGTHCTRCAANLRSIVLADAIRAACGTDLTLREFCATRPARRLRVLEINEAGTLSPTLQTLPGHVLSRYPEVDMQSLPFAEGTFDLVVHSDTLEHVPDPVRGLAECRRVLKPGGTLCFTIPTIIGRLTRSRTGLPPSYHGAPGTYLVHTEFGADAWVWVLKAGFRSVSVGTVAFPAAISLAAKNRP